MKIGLRRLNISSGREAYITEKKKKSRELRLERYGRILRKKKKKAVKDFGYEKLIQLASVKQRRLIMEKC